MILPSRGFDAAQKAKKPKVQVIKDMSNSTLKLVTSKGYPRPYGVSKRSNGTNFALFSKHAFTVSLCFFEDGNPYPIQKVDLHHKTGYIWHVLIHNLPPHLKYAYRIDGPHGKCQAYCYHPDKLVLDPYAKAVDTCTQWGDKTHPVYRPLGIVCPVDEFDWEGVNRPKLALKDLVIYEMHVRGFTVHSSSGVKNKGTYLGVIEKIPHLVELGVNAVELLPIAEFNEMENQKKNPLNQSALYNYWGYSTVNFFSLMNRYATNRLEVLIEFKTMVRELHRHGIEVILDVVFNHTAEGNVNGPVLSYKGIDPSIYYLIDHNGRFSDYTGCGNTFNSNRIISIELIRDCLRYWVSEMQVDGFRFDLASALIRGQNGEPLSPSPLIEQISQDPILAGTKLIAEPWDAAGLYQVGSFYTKESRWSEWNDKYRNTLRQFINGKPGAIKIFATRLCGSEDLYGYKRNPLSSINHVTCHDGFSLYDLVSYNQKHNEENGENNKDGNPDNESWNCGVEGPTTDPKVVAIRERQMRNYHLALMLSQGIPMVLMGDEYQHTRNGNNNPWCQDNERNWFLWDQLEVKKGFFRFYKSLIQFRKKHPVLKKGRFLGASDIEWHGVEPSEPDWNGLLLAFVIKDPVQGHDLYAAFNTQNKVVDVVLPPLPDGKHWHMVVNTANKRPQDYMEDTAAVPSNSIQLLEYSSILLSAMLDQQ